MTPKEIFEHYLKHYDNEVQGCCLLLADEIQQEIGGDVVAGVLTWYGGSCSRTHWWVEKDGETIDPMGDWFLSSEVATGRTVFHRDRNAFEAILPRYEQWRLPLEDNRLRHCAL
jgi:hypothetical protein